jgi:hypothetical protein
MMTDAPERVYLHDGWQPTEEIVELLAEALALYQRDSGGSPAIENAWQWLDKQLEIPEHVTEYVRVD